MRALTDTIPESRYAPTDGVSYNPNDPTYWDQQALDNELERTFALCHACRACVHTCDVFPTLFATCFTNYHKPALGQAAYTVLTHNQCRVACPPLQCCGMPALDGGDVDSARHQARTNVARLLPYVERGYQIAVLNPTCSLMLTQEYPELLHLPQTPQLREAAQRVAAATRELSAYLFALRQAGQFHEDFRSTPRGPIAYHVPCHLRAQHLGFRARDLLRRIPGVQPIVVTECAGHDGTWAMKHEHCAVALQQGQKACDSMQATGAALWVTECPLAALQFEQASGQTALHPVEVLARAYRADGFPQAVHPPAPTEDQTARNTERQPTWKEHVMVRLTPADIDGKETYEAQRTAYQQHILQQKATRRVLVGEHCAVHFESRETVRYQVQEMLRTEESWQRPRAVADELAAYNPLIPQTGELSATLMLAYDSIEERRIALQRLVGLEHHVWLHIGTTTPLLARFDEAQFEPHKISAVQYLKWTLSPVQHQLLQTPGTVVRLVLDHPHYTAQAVLSETTRQAIMHDPDGQPDAQVTAHAPIQMARRPPMYKRILVATGGSPWSEAAVAYAIRLAARTEAELRILTVLTVPTSSLTSEEMLACDRLLDSLEQDGKARLSKAASRATWAGVAYETRAAWGQIPQTMVQTADAEACDLIVLGSRLLTGWKRLRLGSIVNTVAATAHQPVLVVKQMTPQTPQALSWRRILVATGGSAWSDAAVEHALHLAQAQQSEVCLLHVVPARSQRDADPAIAACRSILTAAAARAAAAGVPYTTHVADGNVVAAILDTATRLECDVLVLGSRGLTGWKRLMLGNIANAVAARAVQPVLIVKHFGAG